MCSPTSVLIVHRECLFACSTAYCHPSSTWRRLNSCVWQTKIAHPTRVGTAGVVGCHLCWHRNYHPFFEQISYVEPLQSLTPRRYSSRQPGKSKWKIDSFGQNNGTALPLWGLTDLGSAGGKNVVTKKYLLNISPYWGNYRLVNKTWKFTESLTEV